jgi:hypothetical protein
MKKLLFLCLALLLSVGACNMDELYDLEQTVGSEPGISPTGLEFSTLGFEPYLPSVISPSYPGKPGSENGYRDCEDVSVAFGCQFQFTGYRSNCPDCGCTDGTTGQFGPITWVIKKIGHSEDFIEWLEWESTTPVKVAFIITGGNESNIYSYGCEYDNCMSGNTNGLEPPEQYGGVPEISSIGICYTPCKGIGCKPEGAWAEGMRYTPKGNWATFTPYEGNNYSAALNAGRNKHAGWVSFSAPDNGMVTITIKLNIYESWWFNDNEQENIKIQGYDRTPSGNPAPGRFSI